MSALMKSPYMNSLPLIVKVRFEKFGCFTIAAMNGVRRSFTMAETTVPKAAPTTTPTARSTTLPRNMKSLKPLSIENSITDTRIKDKIVIVTGAEVQARNRLCTHNPPKVVSLVYTVSELSIDKTKTAFVAIDLQKGIAGRATAPYTSDVVIKNASAIAEAFRRNGMPVFLVRVTPSPDGKDALHPIADMTMKMPSPPPDWAEIVPEMGPKPGDFVITKHQWGAFYGTELDLEFRRRGITTMVLCGIATNMGVESTARFAYEYGYNQIFAEDAMAGLSAEEHAFAVGKILPRMGLVRKTQDILVAL